MGFFEKSDRHIMTVLRNFVTKYRQLSRSNFLNNTVRHVTNETKSWERKYKKVTRIDLEKYWNKKLKENWERRTLSADNGKPKFYCLSMFPYPSGRLHMGHVRVYTISDTFANFYRMNGYKVIHPMGWDAFGLPAENAARDRKLDPAEWTKSNISYMKQQLKDLNLTFDWEREFSTCESDYYKWTQYIFTKLFESGLAYQKDALVNWDPIDQTVLADEQVDENGCSWRSGAVVEQKYLKQWFFKTSEYAESLLDTLDEIDEDVGIKSMQRNWIGKVNGCYMNFSLIVDGIERPISFPVFCTNPEAVFGASHVVLQFKYKNELAHQLGRYGAENMKTKLMSMSFTEDPILISNCFVKNPFNDTQLKVVLSDDYESKHDRPTAILCIPDIDEIAKNMADKFNFEYNNVVSSNGLLLNSKDFTGLSQNEARLKILEQCKQLGINSGKMTSSKLCDWLISRQRYWGTPIPIIHCPVHGPVPVPSKDLPVKLPHIEDLSINTGVSPLASVQSWVNTTCPKCGAASHRETDTMDTFVDSSWYFLRYTDPHNTKLPFSKDIADKMMPVDLYIGGKEHATLHLYYARFFNQFLVDQNLHSHREAFKKILAQGIIKGQTHQVKSTGKYIHVSEVDESRDNPVLRETNEPVEVSFQKMSKSKLNGVDPEDFVNEWGYSITRLYVLYAAAPFEDIHWDVKTDVIPGVMRWQLKLWTCVTKLLDARNKIPENEVNSGNPPIQLLHEIENIVRDTNKAINDITNHYKKDCVLSAAITCLMTLAKLLFNVPGDIVQTSPEYEKAVCALIIMSAPMVPHFASELWSGMQLMPYKLTNHEWESDVMSQNWPQPDTSNKFQLIEYKIRVNEETCHSIRLPEDIDCSLTEVRSSILRHKKVKRRLKGKQIENFQFDKKNFVIHISTTTEK
uniref:probable leucine--tRNA ligase, mitochondrial n=1 Tax=Styela clava TaxID=7725 RepID=UPI00193935E0|nr:probable leucine--tRNA ligase, mitochondrial [Styela clava]